MHRLVVGIKGKRKYQVHPRTGETVHVRPKRLAFFKVGKELRERVNERRGGTDGSSSKASSAGG